MHLILFLLGIISICYFLCIAFFVGHGTNFFFIWLLIGIGLITFAALLRKGFWTAHFPLWLRRTFTALVCIGFALFLFVQGFILSGFFQKGPEGLDYVVVLGAQMKTSGPSKALKYRLDEAVRYLEANPDTKVIVSGGQGPDEPMSEAQGMYDYLVNAGIAPDRILLEDQSNNTFQNHTYSA